MLNAVQHQTHHCTINHQTKYFHKAGRQQKDFRNTYLMQLSLEQLNSEALQVQPAM
jgi:hypothetical protein